MPLLTQRLTSLLLIACLFCSGCVMQNPSRFSHDDQVSKIDNLGGFNSAKDGFELGSHDCLECDALEKTGRSGRRAAKWVLFGTIVVILVLIDIFLLPGYHRGHNCFPCTRGVIIWVG
jgi:hypothetical protein